jgi:hypothetical protein
MSQGNDFANYAASEDRTTGSEDVWFVAVASDDIKQMSIDQLDEAFRLGVISGETPVWTEGMETWAPLAEVAELDAEEQGGEAGVESSHAGNGQSGNDYAGNGYSGNEHGARDYVAHGQPQPGSDYIGARQTGNSFGDTRAAQQHSFASSSMAPVTSSFAPGAHASGHLGQSTGPVALNVDEDMPPIRHGRRSHPERWLLAGAGVIAICVTAYNNLDLFSSPSSAASPVASTALAARPYEAPGSAAEKSSAEKSAADKADKAGAAVAPRAATDEPAPANAAKSAAVKSAAIEAEPPARDVAPTSGSHPAPSAKAAASAKSGGSDKESLKGSFSKAFTKKTPSPKAAKGVKPRKAASRATKATKKPGTPRAGSAFDPLNDSLP